MILLTVLNYYQMKRNKLSQIEWTSVSTVPLIQNKQELLTNIFNSQEKTIKQVEVNYIVHSADVQPLIKLHLYPLTAE
jgi:hypothetical protein